MSSPIPIRNIYHLLSYAWDTLTPEGLADIDAEDTNTPIDLLAGVLIKGTYSLIRRGLERDYQSEINEMTAIRGRGLFAQSGRQMLLQQGRVICEHDELTYNTLPNKILVTTFSRLHRLWGLDSSLRDQSGLMVKRFEGVDSIHLSTQVFHRVQLHGNNRYYKFLIHICELIYHECLLDENTGRYRFQDFLRDTGSMARLYEKFLFNFLKKRQKKYKITSERIRWLAESEDDPELNFLPSMLTDISLRSADRTLIIDAKYYGDLFQRRYENKTFRSAHLYQLYAYLKNLKKNGGPDSCASGMLLYPVTTEAASKSYQIDGHDIRIQTLNLAEDWKNVETNLLGIVGCF